MLHCRSWMSRTTSCFQQHTWTLFASHYVISLERYFFQAGKPPGLRLDRTALLFTSLRPSLTWCGRIENTWLWSCRWSQGSRRATIAGRRKESIYSRYRTLFPYKSGSRPRFLRHTQKSRIQKLGLFWGPQKILRASEAGKKKWPKLHHFLEKK